MHHATQEAKAAAEIVAMLLSRPDLNATDLLQLVRSSRRLNHLLDQILPHTDDLLPQASPVAFALVSSRRPAQAGSFAMRGTRRYCRGCGFSFDSNNPIQAAQHRTH